MKSKVGATIKIKTGDILYFQTELPKRLWIDEYANNNAIKKVYGVTSIGGNGSGSQLAHIDTTKAFQKFCSEIVSKMKPISNSKHKSDFEEILQCGFENEENKVYRRFYLCDDVRQYTFNNCKIIVTPYLDGLCLSSIIVDEYMKGNGIGTDIMNKLYDISEELSIPIYLNPYPAGERYEPIREKELVMKLRDWYSKIGFAPINEGSHIWNNFE